MLVLSVMVTPCTWEPTTRPVYSVSRRLSSSGFLKRSVVVVTLARYWYFAVAGLTVAAAVLAVPETFAQSTPFVLSCHSTV